MYGFVRVCVCIWISVCLGRGDKDPEKKPNPFSELSSGEPGAPALPAPRSPRCEEGCELPPARARRRTRGGITSERLEGVRLGLGRGKGTCAAAAATVCTNLGIPRRAVAAQCGRSEPPTPSAPRRLSGHPAPRRAPGAWMLPEPRGRGLPSGAGLAGGGRAALGKGPLLSQSGGATSGGRARGAHALNGIRCHPSSRPCGQERAI